MDLLQILVLNGAWPVLMAYAAYRVVLVFGPPHGRSAEIVVAAVGGVTAWWARVLYSYEVPLDWPFALTVLGVAMMVGPKFVGLIREQRGA